MFVIESFLFILYFKSGCDIDVYLIFKLMEEKDVIVWGFLILGFCKNGKFEEVLRVFGFMKDDDDRLKFDFDIMISVINVCVGLEVFIFGF